MGEALVFKQKLDQNPTAIKCNLSSTDLKRHETQREEDRGEGWKRKRFLGEVPRGRRLADCVQVYKKEDGGHGEEEEGHLPINPPLIFPQISHLTPQSVAKGMIL